MKSLRTIGLLTFVVFAIGCGNQAERIIVPDRAAEPTSLQKESASGLVGPRICFFNEFFNYCYPEGGYTTSPDAEIPFEVGAGHPVEIHWTARPTSYPVRKYRWALDIADVSDQTPRIDEGTDLSHWSIWRAEAGGATLGPWTVGEQHKLFLEVEDEYGLRSLGIVRFTAVEGGNRPPRCDQARVEPAVIWPPNGQLVPVRIRVRDPEGDPVNVRVTHVTQDEPVSGDALARRDDLGRLRFAGFGEELQGKRRHRPGDDECPDAIIGRDGSVRVRAERSARGNGRVYTIEFTATDSNGGSCAGSVKVSVPHDPRRPAIEDRRRFESDRCP